MGVLADAVRAVNVAEFKLAALALDVVVDHVDQDRAAEDALFLEKAVDQIKLVSNNLLLLIVELRFLRTFASKARRASSLDLEGREDVLETREHGLLFLLGVDHCSFLATKHLVAISCILEQVAHLNVVDLSVSFMDVFDRLGNLGAAGRVVLNVSADTLPVEGVQARVHKELTVVEDGSEADVAVLGGTNRNVPILLMSTL